MAESLMPPAPAVIPGAIAGGEGGPEDAPIVGGQSISSPGSRARVFAFPSPRRLVIAVTAVAALTLGLRDAPSPPAEPTAGPTLVSLAHANEAPDAPDPAFQQSADPPVPAPTCGACPVVLAAPDAPAPSATTEPTAPHRTRAAAPRSPVHRLPPLGL